MKKLINLFKKLRNFFYSKVIRRPRIYYSVGSSLRMYNLPLADLNFFRHNSFSNLDLLEMVKRIIKS